MPTTPAPLPRSALLAAWAGAALRGVAGLDEAVRRVQGDDEPHSVADAEVLGVPDGAGLVALLPALARADADDLRLVLPAPGDVLGLPGPPDLNAAAVDAGECVLVAGGGVSLGLVPEVEWFGSAWEVGTSVVWRAYAAGPRRVTDVGGLGEAERSLRLALVEATEALAALDVASWREDAAERVAALRAEHLPAGALPRDLPSRAVAVLSLASRVRSVVELASEDDGGAVSGWEAQRRRDALRGLDGVCRRAVVAALAAPSERPLPR